MANLKSSKTRVKRNKKREVINSNRLNAVRTDVKKVRVAVAKKDKEAAQKAFKQAESSLAKAKTSDVISSASTQADTSFDILPVRRPGLS